MGWSGVKELLHDPKIEALVLGVSFSLSLKPEALEPKHFLSPTFSKAYKAHLSDELIDTPSCAAKHGYELEQVINAVDSFASDANLSGYVQKLFELAERRDYAVSSYRDHEKACNPLIDFEELGIEGESQSYDFVNPSSFNDTVSENLKSIKGLKTRFEVFNKHLESFDYGQVLMICARPGTGKTALGAQLMESICEEQREKGMFFSLEMSNQAIVRRYADVDYYRVYPGASYEDFLECRFKWYKDYNWARTTTYHSFKPLHVKQLRSKVISAIKMDPEIKNILIDHMKLVRTDSINKFDGYAEFTRELAEVAKEFQLRIILLNQTTKSSDAFKKGAIITQADSFGGGDPVENVHIFIGLSDDQDDLVLDKVWINKDKDRNGSLVPAQSLGKYGVFFDNYKAFM